MYVMLNSTRYPAVDYNLSFANQQFSRAYGDESMFGVKYFGMDELITMSNISPVDYKTLYPLFTFDVTKQTEQESPADAVKPARRGSMQKLLQFDVFRFISPNSISPNFKSVHGITR